MVTIATLNDSTFISTDSVYKHKPIGTVASETVVPQLCTRFYNYKDTLKISHKWRKGNFLITEYYMRWYADSSPMNGHYEGYSADIKIPDPHTYIGIR